MRFVGCHCTPQKAGGIEHATDGAADNKAVNRSGEVRRFRNGKSLVAARLRPTLSDVPEPFAHAKP
jgi:hypothetical protein